MPNEYDRFSKQDQRMRRVQLISLRHQTAVAATKCSFCWCFCSLSRLRLSPPHFRATSVFHLWLLAFTMPIEFHCSQCNQLLRVPETAAGKQARCPQCQALVLVPQGSVAAPPPMVTDGLGGTPPIPPPAAHPFGEAASDHPFGDQPGRINPYASPAAAAQGYQPGLFVGGRTGLPWDVGPRNFSTWWQTSKLCFMQPSYAYSIMWQAGGFGQPMAFAAVGLAIGTFGQMIWYVPMMAMLTILGAQNEANGGQIAAVAGAQIVAQLVGGIFTVALGATIGLFIGAAVIHVCLMIVGGANRQYETTLRVLGYAQGSTAWLNVIPCGALVAFASVLVQEVVGLAKAHETTTTKSLLAIILPMIVCLGCAAICVAIFLGAAGASGAFSK
jgi:hypothetical protein